MFVYVRDKCNGCMSCVKGGGGGWMRQKNDIPEYEREEGMKTKWREGPFRQRRGGGGCNAFIIFRIATTAIPSSSRCIRQPLPGRFTRSRCMGHDESPPPSGPAPPHPRECLDRNVRPEEGGGRWGTNTTIGWGGGRGGGNGTEIGEIHT